MQLLLGGKMKAELDRYTNDTYLLNKLFFCSRVVELVTLRCALDSMIAWCVGLEEFLSRPSSSWSQQHVRPTSDALCNKIVPD